MSERKRKEETKPEARAEAKPSPRGQIVDFTLENQGGERARNLADYEGQIILIYSYQLQETRLGPRALITAEVNNKVEKLYTYSRVVVDQLERYKVSLAEGKILRARVERRKRYITLAPP